MTTTDDIQHRSIWTLFIPEVVDCASCDIMKCKNVNETEIMKTPTRITLDPQVMGGKPCVRGMRVTVGMIAGLTAAAYSLEDILSAYPYLEEADVREALAYAASRSQEVEVPLADS